MKTCYLCKGHIERHEMEYMANHAGQYVLIKGVMVEQCIQCGEVYFDAASSRQIDEALSKAASANDHLEVPVVGCSVG